MAVRCSVQKGHFKYLQISVCAHKGAKLRHQDGETGYCERLAEIIDTEAMAMAVCWINNAFA